MAVVVLYKMTPEASTSFQSLQAAAAACCSDMRLKILIYDNTPGAQAAGALPDGVEHVAAQKNAGLAEAYNYALERAGREGFHWLLTLDQDTALPRDFLVKVVRYVARLQGDPSIAAIVPQITGDGRMLSPNYFQFGARPKWFEKGFIGVPLRATYAFNSASTVRVTALRQMGGYEKRFWLDDSDTYMYHQLHRYGKRVFVAGDIQVGHEFSMLDMNSRLTPVRYRNILLAESAFWDLEMSWLAGVERTGRLVGRIWKHRMRGDSLALKKLTREFAVRRVLQSRRRRIMNWRRETDHRVLETLAIKSTSSGARPKVSVCMTSYNGERYIAAQLRSILDQIQESDEVVVVDDASQDHTRELVLAFRDPRICLIEHSQNCGVVASFEEAVRSASGDILFLSDNDDLWAPMKVEKFLQAFAEHPEVNVVSSKLTLIDEHDLHIEDPRYTQRGNASGFIANVWKNRFHGSAMAFRSSLLPQILPFPSHPDVLHDVWIGTRNAISGGKAHWIDEPLLLYRRHSSNVSQSKSFLHRIRVRLHLLLAHVLFKSGTIRL